MFKHYTLTLLFALLSLPIFSQKFAWAKSYKSNNVYIVARDIAKYKNYIYTIGEFNGTCDFDPGPSTAIVKNNGVSTNVNVYITKFDTAGNFIWVKTFGSIDGTRTLKTAVDSKGNIIVCGRFANTCDFDPGPGVFNLPANTEQYYILKLNPAGNFIWAKSFGYSEQNETFRFIATDAADNIITSGSFNDSIDLDPGPARVIRKRTGDPDAFIQKLDSNGNYIKGISIGARTIGDIAFDKQNFYISGSFYDQCDFNPGSDTFILKTNYASAPFVLKLDQSLNFIWAKTYALAGGSSVMHIDNAGDLFIAGGFTITADFDPGPGQYILTYKGVDYNADPFMLKLDSAGNFKWAKSVPSGTKGYYIGYATAMDIQGNFYHCGTYKGTVDFDPGSAVYNLIGNNKQCGYMSKYDKDGNFMWVHSFGDTTINNNVYLTSMIPDEQMNLYACGAFNAPVDFDPSAVKYTLTPFSSPYFDAFLFKWKQNNCSNPSAVDTVVTLNKSTLTARATGAQYQWLDCTNGNPVQGAISQIFKPATSGIYAVEITLNGCKRTSACFTVNLTGINSTNGSPAVIISPNPSNGFISVKNLSVSGQTEISVSDITGRVLYSKSLMDTEEVQLALGETPGLYFVTINNNNGKSVYKIIRD